MPNPSLKLSPTGGPPSPGRRYPVHCLQPGLGVTPLMPTSLKRWATKAAFTCCEPALPTSGQKRKLVFAVGSENCKGDYPRFVKHSNAKRSNMSKFSSSSPRAGRCSCVPWKRITTEAAKVAYAHSLISLGKEHQAVLEECLRERLRIQPLFEYSVISEVGVALEPGEECGSLVRRHLADAGSTSADV